MKVFSVGVLVLATSLTVAPLTANACATLFEHRDYGGASWYMEDFERLMMVDGESTGCTTNGHDGGCESTYYESSWNDSVSSFVVEAGCTLTLWEHINEDGAHFRTSSSYSYVGSDWNDEASETLCTCN